MLPASCQSVVHRAEEMIRIPICRKEAISIQGCQDASEAGSRLIIGGFDSALPVRHNSEVRVRKQR